MAGVAAHWYQSETLADGVTRIHETHVAGWLRCNIWQVHGRDRDLVIDTGTGVRPLTTEVLSLAGKPLTAIVTHTHFDHMGGLHEFEERCGHRAEADISAHPNLANTAADTGFVRAETFTALPFEGFTHERYTLTPAPLTRLLDEGDVIDLGDRVFQVLHLPGHSPGSIALYERATRLLFSGDVVYDGDLFDTVYHSDRALYRESLARLRELPVSTVHGGHYASFGAQRLREVIDEYLAGGRTIVDEQAWIARQNDT